jgi:hypothetical protein
MELTEYQKTIIRLALEEYLILFANDTGRTDLVKELNTLLKRFPAKAVTF